MSFEYAPRGFIGVLTPQANTCVEPEFNILMPKGVGVVNARMFCDNPVMEDRLVDYFETMPASLARFGAAPLKAIGVACTGMSYLAGREREDALFPSLTKQRGALVTNSALAVVDALHALGAQRIGLVSPYPDSLTQESVGYWQSRGFAVTAVAKVVATAADHARSGTAHPVYALGSDSGTEALKTLRGNAMDAIVMLGTGLPSLKTILQLPGLDGVPVFSCVLALAWRCVRAADGADCTAASLREWIAGNDWKARWQERCGA